MAIGSPKIGLLGAVFLVVANMMGTGIFTTTGFLVADMPSRTWVMVAWMIGGGVALLGSLCYGDLIRQWPASGGEYLFLSQSLHPSLGYVAGWLSLLVGFSAPVAAACHAAGSYLQPWLWGVDERWVGTSCLVLFSFFHGKGLRWGGHLQNGLVLLKLIILVLCVIWVIPRMPEIETGPTWEFELDTFSVSLVWIYFSYCGWNAAVYLAGEIARPTQTVPIALILGTLIVIIFYLALNLIFLWAGPLEYIAGKENIATITFESLGGPILGKVLTLAIVIALLTSVSAMTMAGPRVYAQMAEDGYLPEIFTPAKQPGWTNILLQGVLALLMLWIPSFQGLIAYMGFTLGIGASLSIIGLMKRKRQHPKTCQVTGWPWVPGAFLMVVSWVTLFSIWREPIPSLFGILTLLIGWLVWWCQRSPHST